ncbi:hypothetical protein, conserved [Trypanosoma brucei brucei TREU927]|uniref:Cyclic nucleotide-binding domain-containing protein n=2 Tax=Trypanozoon TaxID=39700 RepID=Q387J0_TRYB2|nr:hypothetical protein, conserved [Trypanosoma brucei brucei TREU927]EAN79041.1 hypothetical protein, conserved [Trypanosoma brucei brucei TREU927]
MIHKLFVTTWMYFFPIESTIILKGNMSFDYAVLSPTEIIIYKERNAPILKKVTNLLLRGGAFGYLNLEKMLHRSTEKDSDDSKKGRRINPVTFKSVMVQCGVLLTPEEHKSLRAAYSDEGGFIVDQFLELVCPLRCLREEQISMLMGMYTDYDSAPMIPLDVLRRTLEEALVARSATPEAGESPVIASALVELQTVFTPSLYPKGYVPPRDVLNFFAAILLNAVGDEESVVDWLSMVRFSPESPHEVAPALPPVLPLTQRRERGFDYYTDRDNKDEWIRGREERPPGEMYKRFLPGYAGHIPTYCSKFGRTFHTIEESAPTLTRPVQKLDPVPEDRYGPGVELKPSRMSRHNFKLA